MILDEIVLHDFGVYGKRQKIALTPTAPDKPVILFGGLNGGGKTTLLDALQLCFFGNIAQCSGRGDLPYDEYLRRSVHHGALAPEAAIEVAFRHTVDGEVQNWRLTRSWSAGDTVRERFQVIRNDRLDRAASEQWSAQVEDFIPARIAHLFLFDGEKVEGYADLKQAPVLIRTAIQNLLGLDIVERLGSDLQSMERRAKSYLKTPVEAEALNALRDRIKDSVAERARFVRERAAARNDLDKLRKAVTELDHRFEREGGSLFEDRGRLEAELMVAVRGQEAIRRSLRETAAGAAPLALVRDLLAEVLATAEAEEHAVRCAQTADVIEQEYARLLELPIVAKSASQVRREIEKQGKRRVVELRAAGATPRNIKLETGAKAALEALIEHDLDDIVGNIADLIEQDRHLEETIAHLRRLLAAVPTEQAIAEIIAERDAARSSLQLAEFEDARREADILRLDREIETLRERETAFLEALARNQFEQEDVSRVLTHSVRVRETLHRFRSAVINRHVSRIEGFVLDSFRQLLRKESLVTGLRIDPETFELELRGRNARAVTAERLSAGERQLLAIAMIWGLARASGRPLPTIIDTPLGRLDAEHRSRLVTRYFPFASHQVMLLSTDEEITRRYYQQLRPSIGRTYRLRFDEGEGRTIVEDGYFAEEELV
jgi:DNA sulfur modification protein DndD